MTESEAAARLDRLLADVRGTTDLFAAHDLDRGLKGQRESELLRELRRSVLAGTCDLDVAADALAVLGLDRGRQRAFWRLTWCTLAATRAQGVA
jgi:hypothetical protein